MDSTDKAEASPMRRLRRFAGRHLAGPRLRRARARLQDSREKAATIRQQLARTRAELEQAKADLAEAKLSVDSRTFPDVVDETIRNVRAQHLTFLYPNALRDLAAATLDIERNGMEGAIVETGTALGGSAIVIAAAKSRERPMKVYDVFGMIPEPSEKDGEDVQKRYETIVSGQAKGRAGETYYGYRDNLYDEVTESFRRLGVPVDEHHVELIQGLFADTIDLDEPVALAHLDGDWYDSTMVCLERLVPLLVPGGRIVLDDYDMWSGCRSAVDDYFRDREGFRFEQHARLHVVRA